MKMPALGASSANIGLGRRAIPVWSLFPCNVRPAGQGIPRSVDLPLRWLMSFLDTVIGDKGYLTVGELHPVSLDTDLSDGSRVW